MEIDTHKAMVLALLMMLAALIVLMAFGIYAKASGDRACADECWPRYSLAEHGHCYCTDQPANNDN